MLNVLESEKKLQLRDLDLQLEIAGAQRTEFEEEARSLREEVRDLQEERRIADRKAAAANKDLRRQLQQEKQRNDRLQEKMRDHPLVVGGGEQLVGSPSSHSHSAMDPDRHSISSWSMMSGQNEVGNSSSSASHRREGKASTPIPAAAQSNSSSPHNAESLPRDSPFLQQQQHLQDDTSSSILEKVASLQEDRLVMEEKIRMLENSAAGMADELLKKTTLINYYCMEGGKSGM